jgi:replicative DNA helicase
MSNVETLIIANLTRSEEYVRSVLPYIDDSYFTDISYKTLFKEINVYFERYNKVPPISALKIELSNTNLNTEVYNKCDVILKEITEISDVDPEWLINQTEKFCQDRAIYNAIMESIKIINDESKLDKGAIPNLLQDALSVCFDANIGHDFLEDYESRFDFYNEVLERIPFDIDFLNKITRGGIPRKTLNVILAGTGVGKTLMMCHFAASNLLQGKNVLYITLEMAEERISERIDANLLNVPLNELQDTPKEAYISRIERLKKKTQGKLIVKEYPTASAGAGHFRHLLNELRMKKDFVPDIIYIDYLNLCSSSRMKLGAAVNSYTYIKAIAEELRGLAIEFDLPIFTATQTNRTGFSNSDVGLEDTSESFGLPQTADFMIAAISGEELESLGQLLIKQLKNRYNDPALYRRFVVGVDRARMRLFDVEQSAQDNVMKDIDDTPVMDKGAFGSGLKRERKDKTLFESWS